MQFFAGDTDRIAEALEREEDYYSFAGAPWALGYVDFSMHLGLEDLDTLTVAAADLISVPSFKFSTEIERCLIGDWSMAWSMRDTSADTVSRRWIVLMASIPATRASELASSWFQAMKIAREPADDVVDAIQELIALCATAKEKDASVIFEFSG